MPVHFDCDEGSLDPQFAHDVSDLLAGLPDSWVVYFCTRSCMEQQKLYQQGRTTPGQIVTNAKPGQSAHNFGLAVDVVPITMGQEDWNVAHPAWARLHAAVDAHPRLHGGWHFPSPDNDHIEAYPAWEAKRQQLISSGAWNKGVCP